MEYLIVGNGVAGTTAALALRKRDAAARITLVSGESDYFFSRTALMYAFMDRMNPRDLEPYERKVFDLQRIDRIRGWVKDLNADHRVVRLEDGRELTYDRLLLAMGSIANRISWPGLDLVKEGVVQFVSLQNLAECERLTPSTRQAVVVGGGLIGVELVECLYHHGVEVDFLVREPWYWPIALSKEEGDLVTAHIRKHGIRLHLETEAVQISTSTSGRVSMVRTNAGNEIPCQMLGVCAGVRPAIDWLRNAETPVELGRGILVSRDFRTSLDGVWAAGDCAEFAKPRGTTFLEQIWYSAKRHGEFVAQAMLGDRVEYQPPLFFNSAKFFEIEYTTAGHVTRIPIDSLTFQHQIPGRDACVRIVEHNGAVIGFNMLGARWNHRWFEKWIQERRSMDEVITQLHSAQYDVEFGRTPLDSIRAAYADFRRALPRRAA